MIKTIKTMAKQEKERYNVPRKVQDVIPVRRIWPDGIFLVGTKFTKTYKFTDINYLVASREDKESMFLTYSELLNSLDSGAVTKITVNNRRMNKANFEQSILMPMQGDFRDEYRREYNQMLLDKATGANGITQEKYITISVVKKDIEEARAYYRYEDGKRVKHTVKPVLGEKAAHNGKVVYSLDFDVTPHMLRHTYITNLIHSSVDPKTVQYLAGHESSRITMDIYAKVKYNRPDQLAGILDSAFAHWDADVNVAAQ